MKKFPKLSGKLILAPMHNITNLAFRIMCKKYGASLVFTELISANALARNNQSVLKLAKTNIKEKPNAIQLFGQDSRNIVKAAQSIEKNFDIIDFNLGCPSLKIKKQGCGGALLKRKNKIAKIVKELSSSIKKPITIKTRIGWDKNNAIKIARICEANNASAITIHARTVEQGYSKKADWEIIRKIKEVIKIPIIGNGDIVNGKIAKKRLEQTNCDYLMIGRAAIGNPFIFKQINEYLKTGKEIKQSKEDKIKDYFKYIELTKKYDCFSIKDAKYNAQNFTRGLPRSAELRKKLNKIEDFHEIDALLKKYLKENQRITLF